MDLKCLSQKELSKCAVIAIKINKITKQTEKAICWSLPTLSWSGAFGPSREGQSKSQQRLLIVKKHNPSFKIFSE